MPNPRHVNPLARQRVGVASAPISQPPAPGDHRGRISDEPLINAIHCRVVEMVFVTYAAVLVYMSFVPFDFTRHPAPRSGPGHLWGLPVSPFGVPDILANIALYVPLGALAFAVCRRRRLGRILSAMVTLLMASLTSLLIEHGQYWVDSRVSTWVDVTSNVLGSLLGASVMGMGEVQVRRVLSRARWAARRNGCLTLAKAAVCVVLLVHLRPYDVVVDMFHTAAAVRHADVSPLAGWRGLTAKVAREVELGRRQGMNELPRVQWEYGLDCVADVAAYAAVAALVVLGMASQFSSRVMLYLWAGFVAVSLAAMITVIRIFLISRGLDTAYFFCGVLGWLLGCTVAHGVLRRRNAETSKRRNVEATEPKNSEVGDGSRGRAAGLHIVVGCALAMVVAYELVPFDFGTGPGLDSPLAARRVCMLPFNAHFHSRPNDAFFDISGELLRYGLVGVCMALILRSRSRAPWRRQLLTVVAAAGAAGVVLECTHLVMESRQTDVTTVLIAMAGGFSGAVAVRWVFDYRASLSVAVADDLLTRQLIEGETYKGLPALVDDPLTRQLTEGATDNGTAQQEKSNVQQADGSSRGTDAGPGGF